jgi:hypothetical protein
MGFLSTPPPWPDQRETQERRVEFSEIATPAELAKHLGWSERRIRALARELGACRVLGNRMVLLPEDVTAIMEATRPKPLGRQPTFLQSQRSSLGQRLPDVTYKDLLAIREREQKRKHLQKKRQRAFRERPPE